MIIEDVGFAVNHDLTEGQLLDARAFTDLKPLVHNGIYRSYWTTNPHQVLGNPFYIRFYFEDSRIKTVQLFNALKGGSSSSLNDYAELESTKKINDQWLKDQIRVSARQNESWGSVESVLDKKSWSASIIFRN